MRKIWNKGHRIRASDKHLVYHFSIGTLLFIFVAVLLLLNIKQLMRTDWEHFSLLENGLTLSPYNFITILIATGVCALVAFLYYRFCYDSFKKLLHRQKLARMVLENKWYEADTLHDGYIEYTLLYDMIANRITIDEVRAENGCLKLMKNLVWEYDALPHALIAGGTGGVSHASR